MSGGRHLAAAIALLTLAVVVGYRVVHGNTQGGIAPTGTQSAVSEQHDYRLPHDVERAIHDTLDLSVGGTVRAATREPIARATVCLALAASAPLTPRIRCVQTDAAGRFSFERVTENQYRVTATATGCAPSVLELDLADAASRPGGIDLEIPLDRGGVAVTGTVVDANGGVVAGAQVLASSGDSASVVGAETNDHGEFEIWVSKGPASIAATAAGYSRAVVYAFAPCRDLRLSLAAGATIKGHVFEEGTMSAVPNIGVSARKLGGIISGQGSGISDATGAFVITGLVSGDYELVTDAADWASDPQVVTVSVGDTASQVALFVGSSASISGQVKVDGEACANGEVVLTSDREYGSPTTSTGAIALRSVKPGTYRVTAFCEGALPIAESIDLVKGPNTARLWELKSGLSISGEVRSLGGRPLAGVTVQLEPTEVPPRGDGSTAKTPGIAQCTTDEQGSFACRGLSPATYSCAAIDGKGALGDAVRVALDNASVHSVMLRLRDTGTIRARVTKTSGELVGDVSVFATDSDGYLRRGTRNADGEYVFSPVPRGTYRVYAGHAQNQNLAKIVRLVADGQTETVNLVLSLGAKIRGRVIDERGSPVPDAWVRAEDIQASMERTNRGAMPVLTDSLGQFELAELEPGEYRVRVEAAMGEAMVDGVRASESSVEISLRSYGEMSVTVTDKNGAAIPSFVLLAESERRHVYRRVSDPAGTWRLTRLLPGKWRLSARTEAGSASGEVEIPPAGKAVVPLTLTEGDRNASNALDPALDENSGGGA